MAVEDNKAISRRFLEELWNQKNESIIDELIADTYADHTVPPSSADEELQGPEVFKQVFAALQDDFFDISVSIEKQIAEDDRVVNMVTWRFTLKSDDDPPAASRVVTADGIGIDSIDGGKIVESWNVFGVMYSLVNLLGMRDPLLGGPIPNLPDCSTQPCPTNYVCLPDNKCHPVRS